MIISASYRTDIPAFYADWFIHRLEQGYCKVVNPYNRREMRISLRPGDVEGIVFWTRNIGPIFKHLQRIGNLFPFVVQYTITNYPRALERSVVEASRSIENFMRLAGEFGPRVGVWRYDPIVVSSLTPAEFHFDNFARMAKQLSGTTDEVVISFAQVYRKTRRNMDRAGEEAEFDWRDPTAAEKLTIAGRLVDIAAANRMQLSICSQPGYQVNGATEAKCIDADRLAQIAGRRIVAKLRGNRKECRCFESRDIGDYDTCPHGCAYCYAVQNRDLALSRHSRHDPTGEFLISPQK